MASRNVRPENIIDVDVSTSNSQTMFTVIIRRRRCELGMLVFDVDSLENLDFSLGYLSTGYFIGIHTWFYRIMVLGVILAQLCNDSVVVVCKLVQFLSLLSYVVCNVGVLLSLCNSVTLVLES